jgi:uncharacterized protein YbjT (DUF2867 family)
MSNDSTPLILVTGATGYIGGRLAPRLLEAGYRVRVFVRDESRLAGRIWAKNTEVATGDTLRPETLEDALRGVETAFYLLHAQRSGPEFRQRNFKAAENFSRAARAAGVRHIVHLGALGDPGKDRFGLIASHHETALLLRQSGIPVTDFHAGPVFGSGSVFFEMIRYTTERMPVLICPRWVYTPIQPIAIRDLLTYLILAVGTPAARGRTIEIGGPEVTTFGRMMDEYARARELNRVRIPLPWHLPNLSAHWVHWSTPITIDLARARIESLRRPALVKDGAAAEIFGPLPQLPYRRVMNRAINHMQRGDVETTWTDALASSQGDLAPVTLEFQEGLILEHRQRLVAASPESVFRIFSSLGGENGWLYMNWAWRFRAWLDRMAGGVGIRRGRRNPSEVRTGDAIDFWRVEKVEPNRLLRLRAEMKLFGLGWLEFIAFPFETGKTRLLLTAYYVPKGFLGILYWRLLTVMHAFLFSGLIRTIAWKAETGN